MTEPGTTCPTWQHVRLLRAGDQGCDPAVAAGVALLVIDRPPANELNRQVMASLAEATEAIAADEQVRVVVLTTAGDGGCAGLDAAELAGLDALDATAYALAGQETLRALAGLGKPVIAAMGGSIRGAGVELALAADIRVVDADAVLALTQVQSGYAPGWGGTQRLARIVGPGRAKLLVLGGWPVSAAEAGRIGLVEVVAGAGQYLAAALDLAGRIAAAGADRAAVAKEAIDAGLNLSLSDGLRLEAALFGRLVGGRQGGDGSTAGAK